MEEPGSRPGSDPFRLHSSVRLAPFSPVQPSLARRLSSHFTGPQRPVESTRRRKLAYISLRGELVNAEEASSAASIGLSPEEAVAWELFTPIQRFLIVAVIGVAAAKSKKNRLIWKLQKTVDRREQLVSNMQQKLDEMSEQLNLAKGQSETGSKASDCDDLQRTFKESFGSEKIKFIDCGCWLCDQHHHLLPCSPDKPLTKASTGHEMLQETTDLVTDTEPDERRMSDMSDCCSSVTSAAEIYYNNLSFEQDMLYLKKECQEKDATIKELTLFLQSTNKAGSKRVLELESIIRRKTTLIARLKKDVIVLEQKVSQLSKLRRSSSSPAFPNSRDCPTVRDNLLYDMDTPSSPSSSDLQTPVSTPRPTAMKVQLVPVKGVHSTSEQTLKSAPVKSSGSLGNSMKTPLVSPVQEVSINEKLVSVSSSSSRLRRSSSTDALKKTSSKVQVTSRDSSGSRKRWVQ
ncbi:PREDICTED: uncharacterized protein LOC104799094 [Tarenaya hassleriana]|uniref:uncharacterized protein LOC104799094 n=1 Tax=Tarenaya hassleriana TaxID=28532 RepID=UPI00053C52BB|nr:PREDICTED: uncharacterized protein LOC104799094 [Tarenaya hassleriana]